MKRSSLQTAINFEYPNRKIISHNRIKLILFALSIFSLYSVTCKKSNLDTVVSDISSVRGYRNWYIGSFRCGVFVPPSYDPNKKYPLLIFLHGYSDTTTWNLSYYNEPVVTNDPCIVLTPKCPTEETYGWGDSFDPRTTPMMAKTYEMMDLVEKSFNLDKDRYYICGSSMGGRGTYGVLQKNPDKFAAAYVECGYVNVEIAPIIAKIPIWIFHGSVDPVVPVQPARDLYQAVLNLGGTQIRYTEYLGVGHNVWDYTGKETTITSWFLAQQKGSVHTPPQKVNNFTANISAGKVTLQWDIPAENTQQPDNRIWFCKIYRNDGVIKEVYNNQNSYVDSTLIVNNTYNYKISAVNYYFKESELSSVFSFNF
jgi:predicted peptidase